MKKNFCAIINNRRKTSKIQAICNDRGQCIWNQEDTEKAAVRLFKNIYSHSAEVDRSSRLFLY